jgi:hypothetical protein
MKLVRVIKMCLNETYSKVDIGKHLPDSSPIQNGMQQGDALFPLLFNFALEYAINKVQENQVVLKCNWAHQLLTYAYDVNLLGGNIDIIKKNTETSIDASRSRNKHRENSVYFAVSSPECSSKSGHENSKQLV